MQRPHFIPRRSGAAALLLAAALLGGCAVVTPYDPYGVAVVAPAPAVIGVAPYPGALWIDGYWTRRGSGREWVPGRWERGHGWQGRGYEGHGERGGWHRGGRDDDDDRRGWRGRGRRD